MDLCATLCNKQGVVVLDTCRHVASRATTPCLCVVAPQGVIQKCPFLCFHLHTDKTDRHTAVCICMSSLETKSVDCVSVSLLLLSLLSLLSLVFAAFAAVTAAAVKAR